eukprot:g11439.t1
MRCCSCHLQVASLWHRRRPRMDMSSKEWEGELKWFEAGRCSRLSRTERRCSTKRSPSIHLVSLMSRRPHREQRIQYTTLADVQVN